MSDSAENSSGRPTITGLVGRDLPTRVVSALVLGAIGLLALIAGPLPLAALAAAVAGATSWEWSRIVRGQARDAATGVHVGAAVAAVVLAAAGYVGLAIVVLAIGAILVTLLSFPSQSLLSGGGVLYTGLAGVALVWLRSAEPLGLAAVAFVIVVVIAADTAAYFSGRLVGGPKLWPRISPNKTWAGLAGAIGASLLGGSVCGMLLSDASSARLAGIGALLGLVAQAGDLAESALKRAFGVKDASGLIPGHGGFLDRVDGLIAALAAAAMLAAAVNVQSPARALLLGH